MKEKLEEFYDILKIDREKSAWSKGNTLRDRYDELYLEVDEIRQALDNDDVENLKEEMGDSLWDLLFMFVIAEEKGLFTLKESIEDAMAKLRRRKPWIFTDEVVDKEEESRRWKEAKKKEKESQ